MRPKLDYFTATTTKLPRLSTIALTLIVVAHSVPAKADEIKSYGTQGYYHYQPYPYEPSIEPDIDTLWKVASKKRPCKTTRYEISSLCSTFETSLRSAAHELETGEPVRKGWAVELIAVYTRPEHKFPATSDSLDKALIARNKLIELTDKKTVQSLERKLKRYPPPPAPEANVGDFDQLRHLHKNIAH